MGLDAKIDIVLASFNGEQYIREQLYSIFNQTYTNWQIIIRDDGSTDNTIKIINEFIKQNPYKILLLKDKKGHLGSTFSFSALLESSTSDYIMFCDQDDVWLPDKIYITYKEMRTMEIQYPTVPLLVYTDLKEVDQNLHLISESFVNTHRLFSIRSPNYYEMLALSVVAGCTMMVNKIAKEYILPMPLFLTHDHWIATNIAYYGKCQFVNSATILYRQHSNNSIGSKHVDAKYMLKRFLKIVYLMPFLKKELNAYRFKINVFVYMYYKIKLNMLRLFNCIANY
ncbi:glycosyltransferase family 2 protein [Microbacter margulisiae]|uniref:Glycosyltransferase involved in cell wall biosynthesis n=1 Tax=Microbacter margulisiae TaxID=1350067 RepID=A0A7W5DQM0_9PORP|nr:glycosyltransferase family 2 protein [Microbacter margulisiae]MBB3187196.1 glycosyltransferase involved in cell wall biosynthesis [Microbacter margulisiae]